MEDENSKPKPCFGRLEKVFPRGDNGLRSSPDECIECSEKTGCLRAAVSGEAGVCVQSEKIERAYEAGTIGFFERWSRRKHLQRGLTRRSRFSVAEFFRRLRNRTPPCLF